MNNKMFLNIIYFVFILIITSGCAQNSVSELQDTNEVTSTDILTETVNYFENANGFLAQPEQNNKYPALVLIHEWWGLNDNIKDLAEQFAQEGYIALAVDLYGGQVTDKPDKARELATDVRNDMEGAFTNLEGAITFLKSLPNIRADQLASVGWCFGGGWSYELAKNDLGVQSSVIYYGRFNPEDDLSKMRATILGHFGEDDASIKVDDVRVFQATLNTLSGDHEVFIYPNSGHAFANEGGSAYVPESAELAWDRTLQFLNDQFR